MTNCQPVVTDTVLRMALACWCVDPEHGLTPPQRVWLTTRLQDHAPLTPEERERLREPLLAWLMRLGGERLAAIVARQLEAVAVDLQAVAL